MYASTLIILYTWVAYGRMYGAKDKRLWVGWIVLSKTCILSFETFCGSFVDTSTSSYFCAHVACKVHWVLIFVAYAYE